MGVFINTFKIPTSTHHTCNTHKKVTQHIILSALLSVSMQHTYTHNTHTHIHTFIIQGSIIIGGGGGGGMSWGLGGGKWGGGGGGGGGGRNSRVSEVKNWGEGEVEKLRIFGLLSRPPPPLDIPDRTLTCCM